MRFKNIVYLRYLPLTLKVYNDFYVKEAINLGLNVEYWDLTSLFFKPNENIEDSSHLCSVKKLNSYIEFETKIKDLNTLNSTLFISIMTFEPRIGMLYRILTKYNCTLSVFGRNMFPLPENSKNCRLFLMELLKKIYLKKLYSYMKSLNFILMIKRGRIKKYDIIFLGGTFGWQGIGRISKKSISNSEIVKVNSDDYDNYLEVRNTNTEKSEKYILFLDEYLPLHPDTQLFKIKNVTSENYYPELCDFFSRVENQFNMPVVIAAHPKAIRYKTENFFDGRKIVFDETANLTEACDFVIAHDSTSINYPICFNKKILFISSKSIQDGISYVHENTIRFAKILGCQFTWFDKFEKKVPPPKDVSLTKYKSYKYNYHTWLETEETKTSDIFINFLKN